MIQASDLKGIFAMLPAFGTKDADSYRSKNTINVAALETAVDKIIRDGVDAIATCGSFGEFHTLLLEEFELLTKATIAAVNKRVPVFIGCTSLNTRETMRKMEVAQKAGADGVLCGVPFYFPSTVENAIQFYLDLADEFPDLGISIYHNPSLQHVTLPISAYKQFVTRSNIVAAKDSHRHGMQCIDLIDIVRGKIGIFGNQTQCYPNMMFGAAGCWSIAVWMGPWPVIHLRDACLAGDWEAAKKICSDLNAAYKAPGRPGDRFWRESSHKLVINEAGYCNVGPLRPPFRHIPQEILDHAKEQAAKWRKLCEKYPPKARKSAA